MAANNNILLLHGALGTEEQLQPIKLELQNQYKVFTFNFEGHGGVNSDNEFSIDNFTENVVAFLMRNHLTKIHLFGYSMGGYVALNLAKKQPSLVASITTYGTKFNWTPEQAQQETKMLNATAMEEKVPQFAEHLKHIHGISNWKTVLAKTAQMMISLGNTPPLTPPLLEKIETHTLICIGSNDYMVTIEESRQAAESLPNGKLQILEGFKHPIEKNNPKDLAYLIHTFIVSLD